MKMPWILSTWIFNVDNYVGKMHTLTLELGLLLANVYL